MVKEELSYASELIHINIKFMYLPLSEAPTFGSTVCQFDMRQVFHKDFL